MSYSLSSGRAQPRLLPLIAYLLGLGQYAAAALAHFDEAHARRETDRVIAACDACNGAGMLSFRKPNGEIFSTRCPHDLKKIRARESREGLTRI